MKSIAEYKEDSDGLVVIVRREGCPYCDVMLDLLDKAGLKPQVVYSDDIKDLFTQVHNTVPRLYYRGRYVGDAQKLRLWYAMGKETRVKEGILNV